MTPEQKLEKDRQEAEAFNEWLDELEWERLHDKYQDTPRFERPELP